MFHCGFHSLMAITVAPEYASPAKYVCRQKQITIITLLIP